MKIIFSFFFSLYIVIYRSLVYIHFSLLYISHIWGGQITGILRIRVLGLGSWSLLFDYFVNYYILRKKNSSTVKRGNLRHFLFYF
jgi:hypothetical protein